MTTHRFHRSRPPLLVATAVAMMAFATACTRAPESKPPVTVDAPRAELFVAHDSTVGAAFDAGGTAAPIQQATLSTRLMGSVTDVHVREGTSAIGEFPDPLTDPAKMGIELRLGVVGVL